MADPRTSTPVKTPRRRGGGGGGAGGGGAPRSAQRRGAEGGSNEESGAGEEELFGLLGVTSPTAKPVEPVEVVEKQRGLLSITRADIEASSSTSASTARNDKSTPRSKAGRGKTKGPKDPKEPKETAVQEVPVSDTTFNTSTLSQSLPSTFFAPAPIVGAAGTEGEEGKKKKRAKGKKQAGTDEQDKSIPKKDVKSKGRDLDKGASGPGDTGQVWDIPADAGPSAAQNMTWQQQLGHYPYADSPSRSSSTKKSGKNASQLRHLAAAGGGASGSGTSGAESGGGSDTDVPLSNPRPARNKGGNAKPSAPPSAFPGFPGMDGLPSASKVNRPGHQRRSSADSIPSRSSAHSHAHAHARQPSLAASTSTNSNPYANINAQSIPNSTQTYIPSLMDTLPPFNPAINALRAPQTPAKGGKAGMYKVQALPLLPGEFPRLNAAAGTGNGTGVPAGAAPTYGHGHTAGGMAGMVQGGQYAGASFHNSPAASSLPKPDLEDF